MVPTLPCLAPIVKLGAAHAMLAAQLGQGYTRFGLFDDRHNLVVGESGLFIEFLFKEIPFLLTAALWVDYLVQQA